MATSLKLLVSYKGENEVIRVESASEIINACLERFQIPFTENIKLKRYDPEWEEHVNVTSEEIRDRDKLTLCVVDQTFPVTLSMGSSSSLSSENYPEQRDVQNLVSTGSDEVENFDETLKSLMQTDDVLSSVDQQLSSVSEDEPQTSSFSQSPVEVSLKPWPEAFPIPTDMLPQNLLTALKGGQFPDDRQRKQLIQVIFDKMCEYTRCPTKEQYTQVARNLVKMYPCLAQNSLPMGNSFDYWKTKLSDKFRNERKHMHIGQPPKKKLKLSPGGHSMDFSSPLLVEEDEESIKMHEKWMVDEMKKKKPLESRMRELMDLTFSARRRKVLDGKLLVKDLKNIYPCLFTTFEIQKEFERITGLPVKAAVSNIRKYTTGILRQKYSKDLSHLVNSVCAEESNQQTQEKKVALAFYLLPTIFKGKKDGSNRVFVMEREISQDADVGVVPVIVVMGEGILSEATYKVVCEKQDIVVTDTLQEAFCCLLSTFYSFDVEYPPTLKEFYKFVEVILLKMDTKPTRQVRSVLAKLV